VKVLPLEYWMKVEWTLEDCLEGGRYTAVIPKFNRAGIYLKREKEKTECWFELGDGRAFSYPVDQFEYEMSLLDVERINHRQAAALKEIVAQRLATKEQAELLRTYDAKQELNGLVRNTMRIRKRLNAFQARIATSADSH